MASPATSEVDLDVTPPFLLKLFHKTGSHHRPDEFFARSLPPYVPIYTFPSCTLSELSQLIADADPSILPSPAIGTRLSFRLFYPDAQGGRGQGRFEMKDLGSVVIGAGAPGVSTRAEGVDEPTTDTLDDDGRKTLGEARFVVGDYVSCAILPTLEDGSVAPASSLIVARGPGFGGVRRDNAFGPPRPRGGGRGRQGPLDRDGFMGGVPLGEWRRGEELPETHPGRGRGRGRGRW